MLTPATITVTFTANYAGPHRICWRVQGSGDPYVCTNIVDCVGGGNVCQALVSIMVDPESCDEVTYEGYIQATCLPEESSTDQVPWVVTFTPNPICKKYAITCNNIAGCGTIDPLTMGLNCNGTARPLVGPISSSGVVYVCGTGIVSGLPADYEMVEEPGCCYDCNNYTVTITPNCPGCTLDGTSVYYMDCTTRELVREDFTGTIQQDLQICAVTDSIYVEIGVEASFNITDNGDC